ncbi:OLC1v1013900C1 [Oldenlandia corymbosa var. corymbosa]|uniref:Xyloglucan endotransglucosylase/hydrolase n=1 Tax=Oldenlandia corymbosa var. corymbosa TaxID=529605 RepID=A0AAV1E321_OLDCO|nr:OLC1v1013900C1 [Oldenlandia corymbosa var. corymbosa]
MSKQIVISFSLLVIHVLSFMASAANFSDLFIPVWGSDHIVTQENQTSLYLDQSSGCGFVSKSKYLFGKTTAQIKLVEGDSAGTITAFYLSSEEPYHDELDFEFLGNVSGQPYLIQTNVFVNGTGNREQRHKLWFDPTIGFHNYTFFWNHQYILFQVDDIPIRMYTNEESKGAPFPKSRAMDIHGSLWNGEDWATQGGAIKTNWSNAPFVAKFGSFEVDSCAMAAETQFDVLKCGKKGKFWWDKSTYKKLDKKQQAKLKWAQTNLLEYDYCKDTARFGNQMPKECPKKSTKTK